MPRYIGHSQVSPLQTVWSVDRPYVDRLLDGLHYPDRLKLDRPVDRPTFFSRLIDWSICLYVLKKIKRGVAATL